MPPGSPGIFRRKTSAEEGRVREFNECQSVTNSEHIDKYSNLNMSGNNGSATVSASGWPNARAEYELKQVIGNFLNIL